MAPLSAKERPNRTRSDSQVDSSGYQSPPHCPRWTPSARGSGGRWSRFAYRRAQVLHQQKEMQRVGWRRLELGKVLVEGASCIGLRVDQERASADRVCCLRGTEEHLPHQRRAESAPLFAEVDAEARQQDDGDVVAARPLRYSPWRFGTLNGASRESEVTDHSAAAGQADDIDGAGLSRLGLECVPAKPVRLRFGAAVEVACFVVSRQSFEISVPLHASSRTLSVASNLRSRGNSRGGRSRAARKAVHADPASTNRCRSARTSSAARVAALRTNSVTVLSCVRLASMRSERCSGLIRTANRSLLVLAGRALLRAAWGVISITHSW
jgi:hypothetical protein